MNTKLMCGKNSTYFTHFCSYLKKIFDPISKEIVKFIQKFPPPTLIHTASDTVYQI